MNVPDDPQIDGSAARSKRAAERLELPVRGVRAVSRLLAAGASVPFIARYRKEATGSFDEVAVARVRDELVRIEQLEGRREAILSSLREQGTLTQELEESLLAAETRTELEDRYLPHRPRRRTRATSARERGLGPLADRLMAAAKTGDQQFSPEEAAGRFVVGGKDASSSGAAADVGEALAGARDIVAERASEDPDVRGDIRRLYARKGLLTSRVLKGKESAGTKYRDYFERDERLDRVPSHRVLAAFRGEAEGFLRVRVRVNREQARGILASRFVKGSGRPGDGWLGSPAADEVGTALQDGWRRLLEPAMEAEARSRLKMEADEEAIRIFAANLEELLLAPPLGQKPVLAIDPGFRTGCKTVVLDPRGMLLHHETVQPHASEGERREASKQIRALVQEYEVRAVAVGNGTAGRETLAFLRGFELPGGPDVVLVNESGASVYSASETARTELPDLDITLRGAVSIGRRLQDPLAELVKIDPKSIGVGQYQHDVDQGRLKRSLDDVVVRVVNRVGVDVNTASPSLLSYVSGLGSRLAVNVVAYRDKHGAFRARSELLRVPRLGAKAFEQAAGFLRIPGASYPLDSTAVHPERYGLVERMAADLGFNVRALIDEPRLRAEIAPTRYAEGDVGIPTIRDILAELEKPGRDPREAFVPLEFASGIEAPEDLETGMNLPGVVTNVTAFGAFVDVGVHQDGLVHVSSLAEEYVSDPADIVRAGQRVMVTVLDVDLERGRISLSLKD